MIDSNTQVGELVKEEPERVEQTPRLATDRQQPSGF